MAKDGVAFVAQFVGDQNVKAGGTNGQVTDAARGEKADRCLPFDHPGYIRSNCPIVNDERIAYVVD